jgi:uncharacterized protein (TIGR03086 family)
VSENLPQLHRDALGVMDAVLIDLDPSALTDPTPCVDWDLRTLLEHIAGQNTGLARAFRGGDADFGAWAPLPVAPDAPAAIAQTNIDLADAVAGAAPGGRVDGSVWMPEIRPHEQLPSALALRAHLLDTVVHTWDIAAALGQPERAAFTEPTLEAVWQMAQGIADGETRDAAGFFGRSAVDDATVGTLQGLDRIVAWLGRVPTWSPVRPRS